MSSSGKKRSRQTTMEAFGTTKKLKETEENKKSEFENVAYDDVTPFNHIDEPMSLGHEAHCSTNESTHDNEIKNNESSVRRKTALAAERRLNRNKSISTSPSVSPCPMSPDMFEDDYIDDESNCKEPKRGKKQSEEEEKISWCGTSLQNLCRQSISKPCVPPVVASPDHTVLVHLPLVTPPSASTMSYTDVWDAHHVKMPCSPQSLYPVARQSKHLVDRWSIITKVLKKEIKDIESLFTAILSYNGRYTSKWKFDGLQKLIEDEFVEEESDHFFRVLLPGIQNLALRLPELVTEPVPLLTQDTHHTITLSQLQIASLLANAFFCTFPRRNAKGKNTEYESYPDINFNRLFFHKNQRGIEKLKCIINYFRMVITSAPEGLVSFTRQYLTKEEFPIWKELSDPIPQLHVDSKGIIEDCSGMLQVDFANKYLGGGVLGLGCVQEEIRFVLCPELLVCRLFTEVLGRSEALIVTGVEQYNISSGYASSFEWKGNYKDTTPRDSCGRRLCQVTAIDALHFTKNPNVQYQPNLVCRELQKAYTGFKLLPGTKGPATTVATGNWGCGAFNGDPKLKALIQLVACGAAGRDMAYFTFGNVKLRDDLANIHTFLHDNKVTLGALVGILLDYGKIKRDGKDLINFLYHHLSSYDSETDFDSPPILSRENSDYEQTKDKPIPSNVKLNNAAKTIKDYFKPSSSHKKSEVLSSKPLNGDQIKEALFECDEIIASHNIKTTLKSYKSKLHDVQSTKPVGGLFEALDDLEKAPT